MLWVVMEIMCLGVSNNGCLGYLMEIMCLGVSDGDNVFGGI